MCDVHFISLEGIVSELACMPIPLSGFAVARHETQVYVFGGNASGTISDAVFKYDYPEDTWSTETALQLPGPRKSLVCGILLNSLGNAVFICAGGLDGTGTAMDQYLHHEQGVSTSWTSVGTNMVSAGFTGFSVAMVYGNKFYWVSGEQARIKTSRHFISHVITNHVV